jgi:hypothetical protein
MRKTLVLVFLLVLVGARAPRAEVIDRIMAVVDGQTITLSDVNAAIQFREVQPPPGTPDAVGYTLNRLIERTLILAEVDRFQPPEPDPSEIAVRIDDLQKRAGSEAAFDRKFSVTGTTRDQLRRSIRDDLRITTYLNQRFGAASTEREAAIATWIGELRRRADVALVYVAK